MAGVIYSLYISTGSKCKFTLTISCTGHEWCYSVLCDLVVGELSTKQTHSNPVQIAVQQYQKRCPAEHWNTMTSLPHCCLVHGRSRQYPLPPLRWQHNSLRNPYEESSSLVSPVLPGSAIVLSMWTGRTPTVLWCMKGGGPNGENGTTHVKCMPGLRGPAELLT